MNQSSSPRNMTCIMHDKMCTQTPTWINKSTSMTQGRSQSLGSTRLAVGNSWDFTKHTGDVQHNWHTDIIAHYRFSLESSRKHTFDSR